MIALTARLNERDETIIQLQEELDAYDRIHMETENLNAHYRNKINQLENICSQNRINIDHLKTDDFYMPHVHIFFSF